MPSVVEHTQAVFQVSRLVIPVKPHSYVKNEPILEEIGYYFLPSLLALCELIICA